MIVVVLLIGGDIDYYMAIFISHPISARSRCILARKPFGSRAEIQRPRANIGCDIEIAML